MPIPSAKCPCVVGAKTRKRSRPCPALEVLGNGYLGAVAEVVGEGGQVESMLPHLCRPLTRKIRKMSLDSVLYSV